jgi:glycosyltransferase involved in cell wall biosynthesis
MKVKYYPSQPHCFAFGGFDMQMLNALNSVIKTGVNASKLDIWERDQNFDIIHLWGIGSHNYQIIDWSKKCQKFVVATVLLPYYGTAKEKIFYFLRALFSRAFKEHLNYYNKVDRIVVVNDIQSKVLHKYYKVPLSKIDIIPNIVENKYFELPKMSFSQKYNIENYVLSTGNISSRKNQYNLAKACVNLNLNLVLIGNILDGELAYGKKLENLVAANKNILWIKELPKASDDLVAAYNDCLIFALPSLDETQPISALEATAIGKPLVLLNRSYALQNYYKDAVLCDSPSVNDIEKALQKSIDDTNSEKILNDIILNCKEEKVGEKYQQFYFETFENN